MSTRRETDLKGERLETEKLLEGPRTDVLDLVVGQVEIGESRHVEKRGRVLESGDLISGQVETNQTRARPIEGPKSEPANASDAVLGEIEVPQLFHAGQGLRNAHKRKGTPLWGRR